MTVSAVDDDSPSGGAVTRHTAALAVVLAAELPAAAAARPECVRAHLPVVHLAALVMQVGPGVGVSICIPRGFKLNFCR